MGRQDKGVPCLSPGSRGWNIWGSSAPPPTSSFQKLCLCFPDLSRSVFQLAHSLSLSPPPAPPPISSSFPLSHSLKIRIRESEMANIKMDGIPVETFTTEEFVWGFFAWSQVLFSKELVVLYSLTSYLTISNSHNCT